MSLLPLLMGWPLFAYPVHVVFLEFVIDPACSIVFEAERSDRHVMERPPRRVGEHLFTARAMAVAVLLGLSVMAATAIVFGVMLHSGTEASARAAAFTTLVCGNLGLILANRSHRFTVVETLGRGNRALWIVVAGALVALIAVLYIPGIAGVFRVEPLPPAVAALSALCGAASVAWFDLHKVVQRSKRVHVSGP
jgi:Ca2+-transporting ATPase